MTIACLGLMGEVISHDQSVNTFGATSSENNYSSVSCVSIFPGDTEPLI